MSVDTTPKKLGRYEIVRLLGKGAMGMVFEARDPVIGRTVALKAVNPEILESEESRARFLREARAAGALSHPHIVTLFDAAKDAVAKTYFLAMEYLPGGTLRERLVEGKPLPPAEAAAHIVALLDALDAAHAHGVVHRDVKPENLLFSATGVLKLADFGIARPGASNLTQTGQILGSPFYMAPEQILGKSVDARTDLFSAGAILYEMLSGRKPFAGDSLPALAHAIVYDTPAPLLTSVPPALAACTMQLLAKDPAKRFASAAEARRAVAAALSAPLADDETAVLPSPIPRARLAHSPARTWMWRLAALAVAGMVLAGLSLFVARDSKRPVPTHSTPTDGYASEEVAPATESPPPEEKTATGVARKITELFRGESRQRVAFDLSHAMPGGEVVVEADGRVVLRESFHGERMAFVPRPSTHRGEFFLRPGTHRVRVRVTGEKGKVNVEAVLSIEVHQDESRTLRATVMPGLRSLDLKWR